MLKSLIIRLVAWSVHHAVWVIALACVLSASSGVYVAGHFRINTDISGLVENDARWTALERATDRAFPQRGQSLLVVVQADAPELASAAANTLAAALQQDAQEFSNVAQPAGGAFFGHNALLFAPLADVRATTDKLVQARPLINTLAKDPSLTGLANTLTTTLMLPLTIGQVKLPQMAPLLDASADTIEHVLARQRAAFSWRALVDTGAAAKPAYAFVTVQPVVNYGALKAGASASASIRATAAALHLDERYGARVRLTGEQPLADEEFSSVEDGAALNGALTALVVLTLLWLALRSGKLIVAVLITLAVGLAITAALGLLMVGALNMISVAFMVLFVGLGVDFGVQFGVKYREARFHDDRLDHALEKTAREVAAPLTLAAVAVAGSFFSFLPTAYRGVSELGQIAGVGMFVAYFANMTLLPALLRVFAPRGEAAAPGFARLAPVDAYLAKHRKPILTGTLLVVFGASPLLFFLRFDFNPLHLKDPHTESMATLLALKNSPVVSINDVSVLAPSLADANQTAARLEKLPEVGRATTLDSLIPADQPQKLALIAAAAQQLLPALGKFAGGQGGQGGGVALAGAAAGSAAESTGSAGSAPDASALAAARPEARPAAEAAARRGAASAVSPIMPSATRVPSVGASGALGTLGTARPFASSAASASPTAQPVTLAATSSAGQTAMPFAASPSGSSAAASARHLAVSSAAQSAAPFAVSPSGLSAAASAKRPAVSSAAQFATPFATSPSGLPAASSEKHSAALSAVQSTAPFATSSSGLSAASSARHPAISSAAQPATPFAASLSGPSATSSAKRPSVSSATPSAASPSGSSAASSASSATPDAAPTSDALRVAALRRAARQLALAADDHPGPGAVEARRLCAALTRLASADAATRERAETAFTQPLRIALGQLGALLQPAAITRATLPPAMARDWLAPSGEALIDVAPRVPSGVDPNDDALLARFSRAVKAAAPNAIGGPISILHSADTIIHAFLQAAAWSVLLITVLLWVTLRHFGDVLRTLVPLLVSALVTLELCVVFGMPLNFANIIALPLMLGVGVAFKIYFVMAWRAGQTGLLHSSLTHAVLFSAATTATAFGSLWLSHHPGTASMGRLLALSLLCTLIGAVVFQPVLMGKPRARPGSPASPDSPAPPNSHDSQETQDMPDSMPASHRPQGTNR